MADEPKSDSQTTFVQRKVDEPVLKLVEKLLARKGATVGGGVLVLLLTFFGGDVRDGLDFIVHLPMAEQRIRVVEGIAGTNAMVIAEMQERQAEWEKANDRLIERAVNQLTALQDRVIKVEASTVKQWERIAELNKTIAELNVEIRILKIKMRSE